MKIMDVDVIIFSIPLGKIPGVADAFRDLPAETIAIDTSNHYPQRNRHIAVLVQGKLYCIWGAEQFGRPVVKAFTPHCHKPSPKKPCRAK